MNATTDRPPLSNPPGLRPISSEYKNLKQGEFLAAPYPGLQRSSLDEATFLDHLYGNRRMR